MEKETIQTDFQDTFICSICKKKFNRDWEDWGNMCLRCASIYQDAMVDSAEEMKDD